ncbi:calcium/proton exchanger [Capsulimonas corticalis]|uniref:Ca(2+)/H(+) antiporter n=1 Tax=Capsulimonas corticalis TaxID=2219043 RepID=A0A402CTV0_9BACT|nr:calcium/proton exchanger [Capsulimonas corticalis]BDI28746.1 calcium/proton exchanger [Capsulimonas corticalis]
MRSLLGFFKGLNTLLLFIPVSIVLHFTPGMNPLWVFAAAALAIVPLAGMMGEATEELAKRLGSAMGGLLNATFGNATELIIGLFAIHEGLIDLVKASIVGSIIGNILLVLGASILAGGIKHKTQSFNQDQAESHAINLLLATLSLAVPAMIASHYHQLNTTQNNDIVNLSIGVAGVMLITYLASLFFSLKTHEKIFRSNDAEENEEPHWSKAKAFLVLGISTVLVALESEFLVKSVEGAAKSMGVNEVFIGIIIVAIIGNAAEHSTAVMMALKNKMDITINIAIGSSIQIAMFVAPVLVFAGLLMGHPMTFIFNMAELAVIGLSAIIVAFIATDGKCHWLEGAQLLAAYVVIALAFYFLP